MSIKCFTNYAVWNISGDNFEFSNIHFIVYIYFSSISINIFVFLLTEPEEEKKE